MKTPATIPPWLSVPAIALVVILIYAPALSFPFLWTDHGEVEQGALVPRSAEEVWRTLTMAKGAAKQTKRAEYATASTGPQSSYAYFRPVKALSYGLDQVTGGGSPTSFHLTNLILHLLCSLAILFFLRALVGPRIVGLAEGAALLHAVSPLHAEVVGWISARSDSLVALFTLLAMFFLLRARRSASPFSFRLAAALMCCLAFGAKESGLFAGPMLAVLSIAVPDGKGRSWWRRALSECWPAAVLLTAMVAYRLFQVADIHLAAMAGRRGLGAWTVLDLFGRNLLMSFVPVGTTVADTVEVIHGPSLSAVLGPAVWLAWLAVGLRLRHREPLVVLCALGWLLFILPVAQLFPLLHPRGDRYLYLPAIFAQICLVLPLTTLFAWAKGSRVVRLAIGAGASLALLALALTARSSLDRFSDERSLFEGALRDQPQCIECYNNLAFREAVDGRYEAAVHACRAALAVDRHRFRGARDGFSLRFILSRALLLLGRGSEAAPILEELVVKAGPSPDTLVALAEAYLQAGRGAHALAAAEWALSQQPSHRRLLGLVYHAARFEHDAGFPWLFTFPEGCLSGVTESGQSD